MNKESLEHLSSLMDGEISKDTGRFLVRRLGSDGELRAAWARYHVVRDCLRHHEGNLADYEFSSKIQKVLADDVPMEVSRSYTAQWLKPMVGVAIAASVALMAIVSVGPGTGPISVPAGEFADNPQSRPFVSPNTPGLSSSPVSQQASTAGLSSIASQRMNSYLLRHYQVAGSTGGKGFVTFVPIVVAQGSEQKNDEVTNEDENGLKNGNEPKLR